MAFHISNSQSRADASSSPSHSWPARLLSCLLACLLFHHPTSSRCMRLPSPLCQKCSMNPGQHWKHTPCRPSRWDEQCTSQPPFDFPFLSRSLLASNSGIHTVFLLLSSLCLVPLCRYLQSPLYQALPACTSWVGGQTIASANLVRARCAHVL